MLAQQHGMLFERDFEISLALNSSSLDKKNVAIPIDIHLFSDHDFDWKKSFSVMSILSIMIEMTYEILSE